MRWMLCLIIFVLSWKRMSKIPSFSGRNVIGVDLGLTGAISLIDRYGAVLACHDMPTYPVVVNKKKRNKLAIESCVMFVRQAIDSGAGVLVIEDVHAMGGSTGNNAAFSLGGARATFETVCVMLDLPCVAVLPTTWKRHYDLLKTEKEVSIERAKNVIENSHKYLTRKKDHGRAESMLIAKYWADTNSV